MLFPLINQLQNRVALSLHNLLSFAYILSHRFFFQIKNATDSTLHKRHSKMNAVYCNWLSCKKLLRPYSFASSPFGKYAKYLIVWNNSEEFYFWILILIDSLFLLMDYSEFLNHYYIQDLNHIILMSFDSHLFRWFFL